MKSSVCTTETTDYNYYLFIIPNEMNKGKKDNSCTKSYYFATNQTLQAAFPISTACLNTRSFRRELYQKLQNPTSLEYYGPRARGIPRNFTLRLSQTMAQLLPVKWVLKLIIYNSRCLQAFARPQCRERRDATIQHPTSKRKLPHLVFWLKGGRDYQIEMG